jgi:hypothetical protein
VNEPKPKSSSVILFFMIWVRGGRHGGWSCVREEPRSGEWVTSSEQHVLRQVCLLAPTGSIIIIIRLLLPLLPPTASSYHLQLIQHLLCVKCSMSVPREVIEN